MNSLNNFNFPGKGIVQVIASGCIIAILVGLLLPDFPKLLAGLICVVADLCVLYVIINIFMQKQAKQFLPVIVILCVLMATITTYAIIIL